MGYRVRLGRIPKLASNHYAHFKTELEAMEYFDKGKHALYRPPEHQELIELGKYVDYKKEQLMIEDFYNFAIAEEEFVIVDRDFLLHIINEYRANTEQHYKNLIESCNESEIAVIQQHFNNKLREWDKSFSNHLKTEEIDNAMDMDGALTRSWKFEYAVFNLMFILHTFDWDNDYLIYSGY